MIMMRERRLKWIILLSCFPFNIKNFFAFRSFYLEENEECDVHHIYKSTISAMACIIR